MNGFSLSLVVGVVLKFIDNRTNSERTLYLTAHVSVRIFYVNVCRVSITGKQRSGRVRLVIVSVAVSDKLSSILEMSATCHTRGVPGVSGVPMNFVRVGGQQIQLTEDKENGDLGAVPH